MNQNITIRIQLLIFIFAMLSNVTHSAPIKVQGIVKDSQTKEVLVYASMGLKKYPLGTCTNLSGEFQLIVDDSLAHEQITVSVIGYETKEYKISEMKGDYFEILMEPINIQLADILVLPEKLTGEEVLKRVIKNHSKNYPFGFCYYETFFRDLVVDNHKDAKIKNFRLTEAAVNIEDFGLDAFREPKFKIHEIRNSYNYVETSLLSRALIWKIKNPLNSVYDWRNAISKNYLKKLLNDECYTKKIHEITMIDNSIVYVLDLHQAYYKLFGIKSKAENLQKTIRLFVKSKDWSVIEISRYMILKAPTTDSLLIGKVQIKMQEYNKKYYLKLIDFYGPISDEYFKFGTDVDYRHQSTLLVNNVVLDRKSIDRIRRRNSMKTELPLWNAEYKYNPEFWKTYNILLDKPLDPSVKKDLEREIPLENQFIDRGLKNLKK
ncbi:MAG: carboxypeptidase-like regulatory domain-containing protein [Bacteroidota bacterium]|nr:carboxypeptidase-like regulatory domain-containing protein [Bacteroidota bacterium]